MDMGLCILCVDNGYANVDFVGWSMKWMVSDRNEDVEFSVAAAVLVVFFFCFFAGGIPINDSAVKNGCGGDDDIVDEEDEVDDSVSDGEPLSRARTPVLARLLLALVWTGVPKFQPEPGSCFPAAARRQFSGGNTSIGSLAGVAVASTSGSQKSQV
nr:hypothetical protein Iba_chr02aCG11200 [Ipomoea batatas]